MRSRGLFAFGSLALIGLFGCDNGGTGGSGGGGAGGAGGSGLVGPPSWNRDVTPPSDADAAAARAACTYKAGNLPAETQGESHPNGADIPVDHIVVVMMENRSFDHYFQKLPESGQPEAEVAPSNFTNPDAMGMPIAPYHDDRYCFVDTNHEWSGSHDQYNAGAMDGFVTTNEGWGSPPPHPLSDSQSGVRAMAYYDETDIPFYYWLANEYAIADHYFCSLLGPTWPNRQYLYASSSRGSTSNGLVSFMDQKGACMDDTECGGAAGSCVLGSCKGSCTVDEDCGVDSPVGTCVTDQGGVCLPVGRTLFDYMEQRQLSWKVYASGTPGFALTVDAWLNYGPAHQFTIDDYYANAAAGTLPDVAFVDPHIGAEAFDQDDEHPPATPFAGQAFAAKVIDALQKSPNWSSSALFFTYDEHGGLWDHMPPPEACPPGDFPADVEPGDPPGDFDRYGIRVPMIVVSPFAKQHHVSHDVYDHTSIVRFIQARFVLPAISNRDANAFAPWDMFDFDAAPHMTPPALTLPDPGTAQIASCEPVWVP